MPVQNEKPRILLDADEPISVTVDASDLTGAAAEPLKAIMARYGRPISAKAFADFQQTGLAELAVQLYQLGFTLVHCPTWPNGDGFPKSVVSDILAQDLRDQLEELEGVETFIVAATSREYIAVANSLRRHDKRVVIVGEEARVSRELRLCADEFVVLPPSKPERAPVSRVSRTAVRTEPSRIERAPEPTRVERPAEPVTRAPEPARVERAIEPVRAEKAPEPQKVEKAAETPREVAPKAESQETTKLPSDTEVVAEVRRIVAAEGICTPRRLARALCPVDRTPTGELRSRIANRIQTLVDSGKLVREKLVVGGTSVETILVGEDRADRPAQAVEAAAAEPVNVVEEMQVEVQAPRELETTTGNGSTHGEPLPQPQLTSASTPEPERKVDQSSANDIDAFVESFLRSAGAGSRLRKPAEPKKEEPKKEPRARGPKQAPVEAEAAVMVPEVEGEPVVASIAPAEEVAQEPAAKKPRSRRRTSKKSAAPESEATA